MPGRRTEPLTRARSPRRTAIAIAVPTALVGLAGTLAFAGPAFAASEAAGTSTTMPFPTAICGTSTSSAGSSSTTAKGSPSASAQPSASASPSASKSRTPSASASPSASSSAAANSGSGSIASPSASPSASTSTSSGSGFFGWLNGIWQWITGASVQLPHVAAAPVLDAAYAQSVVKNGTVKQATVKLAAVKQASVKQAAKTATSTATCVPSSELKAGVKAMDSSTGCSGNVAAQTPWHLSTPSMTMKGLTYNGVTTIKTWDAKNSTCDTSLTVMDFTADSVTLDSMVTYSDQGGGKLQYVNGGKGQTVTLTNVHLQTTTMTADVLGLLNVTLTPTSTPTQLLNLLEGFKLFIPVLFTNVEADNAFLSTSSIDIPGFDGHGN